MTDYLTEYLHWVAGAFELLGLFMLSHKKVAGFLVSMLGCSLWVVVAFLTGVYGLLFVCIPGVYFNIQNFKRWGVHKRAATKAMEANKLRIKPRRRKR